MRSCLIYYFDTNSEIEDKKLITKIYDKRKYFKFNMIAMLYFNSSIHISPQRL